MYALATQVTWNSVYLLHLVMKLIWIAHLNALHVCVSNPSDMEFRLFIALGNEIDMAHLTFLRVNDIYFVLKSYV